MPLQFRPLSTSESATLASRVVLTSVTSPSKLGPRRSQGRRRPAIVLLASCLLLSIFFLNGSYVAPEALTPVSHQTNSTSEISDEKPLQRPNTILVLPTHGGIGNQLYFLLEALVLARHAHLDLVIPSIPPRDFGPLSTESTEEHGGDNFWDLTGLERALKPYGRVLRSLPDSCEANFDAVYSVRRTDPPASPPPPQMSSRVKQAACFLVSDYDWRDRGPPKKEEDCVQRVFKNVAVVRRYLPLLRPHEEHFVDELKNLREQLVLPSGSMDPTRPACVIVDGHSFNIAGKEGHEYLYSFMHYIEPVARIADTVSNWNVDGLAVLHLRYDEKECVPKSGTKGKVCIRTRLKIGEPDTVYWAPIGQLVSAVAKAMISHETPTIYIAASPYVPEETVAALHSQFSKHVVVAPRVQSSLDHNEQNFLERELALRSKCFIGDFASTWSGTVYYKRRTLGLKSLWSSVLLDKSPGLGYYEDEEPIPLPAVFESSFASSTV